MQDTKTTRAIPRASCRKLAFAFIGQGEAAMRLNLIGILVAAAASALLATGVANAAGDPVA
jgi:hypothetical protein